MKKSTIKDVSKATGLSLGTISKYINGGAVKEKNRLVIERAIEELGYSIDDYARGLITNKTKTIGLLIPEFSNLFYAQIASELELALSDYGYNVAVCESYYDTKKERDRINWLISHRMAALVVIPCGLAANDYAYLKDINVPVIFLDQYIKGVECEFVLVNNREICKEGVGYLLDSGHKDIMMIAAQQGLYTSDERVQGYRDAYKERGLDVNESLILHVEENIDKAYRLVKNSLLDKNFTALFAGNFPNTFGSIFAINELKFSVPNDLSFIGFDDMMFTHIFRPKLTIVDQPIKEIARFTKKRIFELMDEEEYHYQVNKLACKFIVNNSTLKIN